MHKTDNLMIYNLKKAMQSKKINARQLALKANVGKSFIYDILNGKSNNPTSSKLRLVAKALGVSLNYLIGEISNDRVNYNNYAIVEDVNNKKPPELFKKEFINKFKSKNIKFYSDEEHQVIYLLDASTPTKQESKPFSNNKVLDIYSAEFNIEDFQGKIIWEGKKIQK